MDILQLDLYSISLSLVFGIISTMTMTLIEIPFWKRWKLTGILEWHENQVLTSKIFKTPSDQIHFVGIFFFHFLNGSFGGLGLLLALILIPSLKDLDIIPLGLLYGFFLWIITLVPIHKPITGINPWNHPLGKGPSILSLFGHFIYGVTLVMLFIAFLN